MGLLRFLLIAAWFAGAAVALLAADHFFSTHWLLERVLGVSLYVTLTLIVIVLWNDLMLSRFRD